MGGSYNLKYYIEKVTAVSCEGKITFPSHYILPKAEEVSRLHFL